MAYVKDNMADARIPLAVQIACLVHSFVISFKRGRKKYFCYCTCSGSWRVCAVCLSKLSFQMAKRKKIKIKKVFEYKSSGMDFSLVLFRRNV